jgi:transcriptional regulator with GAF, ATPase, and Fis domain
MIIAPMIRGDTVIGAIGTSRREPKAFDDGQVALIKTFADQAVIAIENARLFVEVQARTRELAKTVEDLEIANQRRWRGCGRTFPVRRPFRILWCPLDGGDLHSTSRSSWPI